MSATAPASRVLPPDAIGTSQYTLRPFGLKTSISTSSAAALAANTYGHVVAAPSQVVASGLWYSGRLDPANNAAVGLFANGTSTQIVTARVWGFREITDGNNTEWLGSWLFDLTGTISANAAAVHASSVLITPAAGQTWYWVDTLVASNDNTLTPGVRVVNQTGGCALAVFDLVGMSSILVQTTISTVTSAAPVFTLL